MRRCRRDTSVRFRGDARELPELPVEVGLVAIAGSDRQVGPRRNLVRGDLLNDLPKAMNPTVQLRRQPDSLGEKRNKLSMAVAALRYHLTHVDGVLELRQGLRHGGMKTANPGLPRGKERFKRGKLQPGRTRLKQLLARHFSRGPPQFIKTRMAFGKFVGWNAEQGLRRACAELDTY